MRGRPVPGIRRPLPDGRGRPGVRGRSALLLATALPLMALLAPLPARGQEGSAGSVRLGGLLRTGFRAGPADQGQRDGFELYDVRLRASGKVGIIFDYHFEAEFDDDGDDDFELLDARLTLPILPELNLDLGQFKAPFGKEALLGKGEITFVERSQASQLLAPGRQVGAQIHGETLEGRLTYRGGIFNGNGREFENDDDSFLYAARVQFNNVGGAEFFDELVVEVGANVAFSSDSAATLSQLSETRRLTSRVAGLDFDAFTGDRLLYGFDLRAGFRGFFLRTEWLWAEFEPETASGDGDVFDDFTANGGHLEAGYNLWGFLEGVVRWDSMDDFLLRVDDAATNPGDPDDGTDFLVFGLNLLPGATTKLGLQYAVGVNGSEIGPGWRDSEFALNAQVDF